MQVNEQYSKDAFIDGITIINGNDIFFTAKR